MSSAMTLSKGMMKNMSSSVSRREFLTTAAGGGGAMLLGPRWLKAADEGFDTDVAQVISGTIGIDMHNHVYPAGTEPHPHFGRPPGAQSGRPPGAPAGGPPRQEDHPGPDLFLPDELKRSGFTAVCASYVLDFAQNDKPGDARENLFRWFTAIDAQLERGHIRRALTLSDLQSAKEHGKPTIVQTVEGAQFIEGHLDRVEEVYKRGLRHLQLLHMRDDMVSPLGDLNTDPPHLGGLTAFGAQVVKECNRLGIVVDMAHASHETVLGALKVARQPLVISHTNIDTWTGKNPKMAEMMKPHLISKDHAKVVADAGGIVGVWTHLTDSPAEFVESIKAMVDAIGIDHVGIGSDTDLLSSHVGQGTNSAWPGATSGFFNVVVGEMLRQGFTPDEIGKVGGGNYCRVFDKVTAGHT
jgi:membrane dipeptidase